MWETSCCVEKQAVLAKKGSRGGKRLVLAHGRGKNGGRVVLVLVPALSLAHTMHRLRGNKKEKKVDLLWAPDRNLTVRPHSLVPVLVIIRTFISVLKNKFLFLNFDCTIKE